MIRSSRSSLLCERRRRYECASDVRGTRAQAAHALNGGRARGGAMLHSVSGPPGSSLARWLGRSCAPYGALRPVLGPFSRPIVRVSGAEALVDEVVDALPVGAARAEALAVKLRRSGVELRWGAPDPLPDTAALVQLSRARGVSSVDMVRTDPSLLTEMQLGSFFHAYWRRRVLRHAFLRLARRRTLALFAALSVDLAADLAFWAGVRSVATDQEWRRFARSSYVVFYYHRIGRGGWPGQEHLDLLTPRFEWQLRVLRFLRFRALSPDELVAFHTEPDATLSPRSFVLTADDGFRDAVAELQRHATLHPQVFVNTSGVGGIPPWALGQQVAGWEELRAFAEAGGTVASHCRHHPRLPTLDSTTLADELEGSLREIRARFPRAPAMLAYPHGHHDLRVRAAVNAAGYVAAFTTMPGRNGAGIDPYCLRRIGLKDWDGWAEVAWKAIAGEWLPRPWGQVARAMRRRRSAAQGAVHATASGAESPP
jgi:peptidoglycan/xylan/chitin deacetylase (PgdA/CDA1 family)